MREVLVDSEAWPRIILLFYVYIKQHSKISLTFVRGFTIDITLDRAEKAPFLPRDQASDNQCVGE